LYGLEHRDRLNTIFDSRSAFLTFMVTVVRRRFADWSRSQGHRWRPSRVAARLGRYGLWLERLTFVEHMSARTAVDYVLRADHAHVQRSTLEAILVGLPSRIPSSRVGIETATDRIGPSQKRVLGSSREAGQCLKRLSAIFESVLGDIRPHDLRAMSLRYGAGLTADAIALREGTTRRRIFERWARVASRLRAAVEDAGLTRADIEGISEGPSIVLELFHAHAARHSSLALHALQTGEVPAVPR
jgi:DNA-directed RNA polymerase specialized sigma24 family protein